MTTATSRDTTRFAETAFEPIDGGYLFAAPSPWLFGPGRRFIVTEGQRSALLDTMWARRPGVRIALIKVMVIAFTVGVSLLWWLFSRHKDPTALDLAGMAVTLLGPLYLAAVVFTRRHLRRIAPILATAVPTQARLTGRARAAIPARLLDIALAVWAVAAVFAGTMLVIHPTLLNAVMAVIAAALVTRLLRQRLKRNAS